MSKIYKQWMERVAGDVIKHSHVIALYNQVYPLSRGWMAGGHKTNLTRNEAGTVIAHIMQRARDGDGIRAEEENEERGRLWLANMERPRKLPKLDWSHIQRFTLVGFHVYKEPGEVGRGWIPGPAYASPPSVSPIWRCHFPDGAEFDYAPTAWQSGTDKPMWWREKVTA